MFWVFKKFVSRASFTLIELLVVIAILAVLSTAVILVLNPAEMVKAARDSTRLSDLAALNKALNLIQGDVASASFGSSSVVYISIPDSSPTCANLGLPTLLAGWSYKCVSSSTLTKTNGTGWVPVDLTQFSAGSILSKLPVDPVNTTSTGNYYTYTPGGSWEFTTSLESQKQQTSERGDKGTSLFSYEIGSNLSLTPFLVENRRIISDIPKDMKLWLSAETGTTKDSQDKISAWQDQSLNNNSFSQSNSLYQPTHVLEVQNQLPGIRFDGLSGVTMNFFTFGGITLNDFTFFLVLKTTTTERGIFSGGGNACTFYNGSTYDFRVTAPSYYKVFRSNWSNGTASVLTLKRADTLVSAYLNGVDNTSSSVNNNSALSFYKLGTWSNYVADINSPFNGYIFEFLIYNRSLSDTERSAVENYLKSKYQIN